jgi:hypothetical protein
LVYALLDGRLEIDRDHLAAALAVWRYCEASCVHIWGNSLGEPVADRLLRDLGEAGVRGLNRTEMHGALGRNFPAGRLDLALEQLLEAGLASSVVLPTEGRPEERWYAGSCTPSTGTKNTNLTKEAGEGTRSARLAGEAVP